MSEAVKKVAFRQWSTTAQFLRNALEDVVMVAQDEGQMTNEAVELFWTSCT